MIRGTTAHFTFKIPYPKDELAWATIKFWQEGNTSLYLPITKKLEHCDAPEGSMELCVSLTADETKRFSEKYKGKVQIRAQHSTDGTIFGNRPTLFTVYPMNDGILDEDPTLPAENADNWVVFDGGTVTV